VVVALLVPVVALLDLVVALPSESAAADIAGLDYHLAGLPVPQQPVVSQLQVSDSKRFVEVAVNSFASQIPPSKNAVGEAVASQRSQSKELVALAVVLRHLVFAALTPQQTMGAFVEPFEDVLDVAVRSVSLVPCPAVAETEDTEVVGLSVVVRECLVVLLESVVMPRLVVAHFLFVLQQ
jgi:hypothetical protein